MIKVFDNKRMELKPEDHSKLSNKVDVEKIIFWTILSVVLICILFAFFWDFISLLFYLVPMFINYSFFNPLFFLGIVAIIGVAGSFGSSIIKSFKSQKFQHINENDEKILNNAIRKKISHFLQANIGSAYSKDALFKSVVEEVNHPYLKKYIKNHGEKGLKELVSEGKIITTQKNGEVYYFISQIEN